MKIVATSPLSRRSFLSLAVAGFTMTGFTSRADQSDQGSVPSALDHILLGIDDLDRGIAFVHERTGVRAAFGGVHPGRGTRNALLKLGTRRYLEIIAPDPKQTSLAAYPQLREMREPRLLTWAVHTDDIDGVAKKIAATGVPMEGPEDGSRTRPDGKVLHWKALRLKNDHGGLLPFFIQWSRDSVHPSEDAPAGCHLVDFSVSYAEREELSTLFSHLGLDVNVQDAAPSRLRARITGTKGTVDLRS